ncbi:hypothetical protein B0H15DRAFT_86073 [Mycena belliarum]|uniref:Uncharacterized protein n=1 Tax=Mycena belliarum TaxID=1033014 RepID=A0AAD6TQY7_9AGAR|nr:hypothetical protein B0H15DRAFT_86073 [Mycena belliae]
MRLISRQIRNGLKVSLRASNQLSCALSCARDIALCLSAELASRSASIAHHLISQKNERALKTTFKLIDVRDELRSDGGVHFDVRDVIPPSLRLVVRWTGSRKYRARSDLCSVGCTGHAALVCARCGANSSEGSARTRLQFARTRRTLTHRPRQGTAGYDIGAHEQAVRFSRAGPQLPRTRRRCMRLPLAPDATKACPPAHDIKLRNDIRLSPSSHGSTPASRFHSTQKHLRSWRSISTMEFA